MEFKKSNSQAPCDCLYDRMCRKAFALIALVAFLAASFLSISAVQGATPSAGLISHWTFDEGSGTTAGDSAGTSPGNLVNGPTWTTSQIGGALNFDGVNDYVNLGTGPSVRGLAQYTLAAWVNLNSFSPAAIYNESTAFSTFRLRLLINSATSIELTGRAQDSDPYITFARCTSGFILTAGAWAHIAAIFDSVSDVHSLYVNGVACTNNPVPVSAVSNTVPDNNIRISSQFNNVSWVNGKIDDVRLYNRALTAAEVLSLYNAGTGTPPPPPPPFDFALSNGGDVSVGQGQSVGNIITASLTSGTSQSATFSDSALPSGAVGSFTPTSCIPTCSTTYNIATSATTPTGNYPITITATAGSVIRTTSFTLTVTSTPPPPPPPGGAITLVGATSSPVDNGTQAGPTVTVTPPSGMQDGDLVVVLAMYRTGGSTIMPRIFDASNVATEHGGQTWNWHKMPGSFARLFWCRFNGTWSADPVFSVDSGTNGYSVVMLVFRPSSASKIWQVDVGPITATYTAPSSPFTVTIPGITTVNPSTVSLAVWAATSSVTWGSLFGSGWTQSGLQTQYRNVTGAQQSLSFAYQIKTSVGPTNDVSQDMSSGVAGATYMISFAEVDPLSGGTGGPVAYVQSAGDHTIGAATTMTATFGSPVTSGNAVVGMFHYETAGVGYLTGISDDGGNQYEIIQHVHSSTLEQGSVTFWHPNITNGPTSVTARLSSPEIARGLIVHEVSGIHALGKVSGIDWKGLDAFSAEIMSTPQVTPAEDGHYLFGAVSLTDAPNRDTNWFNPLGSWTERLELFGESANGTPPMASYDAIQATAAPVAFDVESDLGANHLVMMATFKRLSVSPPPPPPPPPGFDFSVWNSGNVSAVQGQSAQNTITAILLSSASQNISFAASGLPPDATAVFFPTSCSPTCTTTITISTLGTTPIGNSTITVTATGGSVTKTTSFTLTVNAPAPPPPPPTIPGLISHWTFDEGSGTTAGDSAGTNPGTLVNGPAWTTGKIGTAVSLDGVNDYINMGSPPLLDDRQPLTLAAWVNLSPSYGGLLFSKRTQGLSGFWQLNLFSGNNSISWYKETSGNPNQWVVTQSNVISANNWQHIALTWDGTVNAQGVKIYVNGTEVGGYAVRRNGAGTPVSDAANNFSIGSRDGASDFLQGSIDDVRLYNRALTATEVQAIFAGNP